MEKEKMSKNQRNGKNKNSPSQNLVSIAVFSFFATLITIALILIAYFVNPNMAFPLILVFSVIDFIIFLTLTSRLLNYLGLSCKDEALGLPEGSVRAIIALSLIIIFAIMAIFMQMQLSTAPLKNSDGTIMRDVNGSIIFDNYPSQDKKDFALQTLTTISTLVVAVAGFYFGTKAVQTAQGKLESKDLAVSPESPVTLNLNEQSVLYPIRVITIPENEDVNWKIDDEKNGKLEVTGHNEFKYTPSETVEDMVILTFRLSTNPDILDKLRIKIVKKPIPALSSKKEETEKEKETRNVSDKNKNDKKPD
jgi:hypothetical protein